MTRTVLYYTLVLLLFAACKDKEDNESTENILRPYDEEMLRMTWPAATFDVAAYKDAQRLAHASTYGTRSGEWRLEGPTNIGGRINHIAVDPFNENVVYASTPNGGIWKTTDGGQNWLPIFDNMPFLAISHLAIDPQNSNILYASTGDANISGNVQIGDGMYKSTDAGATWNSIGLSQCGIIAEVIIDPNNSNLLYAAAMGNPFIVDANRGLYKSSDGGNSWEQVLFVANNAGIIDMEIDPNNAQIIYAASFNRFRTYASSIIAGEDAKIWKSIDGGQNWIQLSNGLPSGSNSRIGLAISRSNANVLYASYAAEDASFLGVYHTTDAGSSWQEIPTTTVQDIETNYGMYYNFGWYFGKIYIHPQDNDHIYVLGVNQIENVGNGDNWTMIVPPWYEYVVHADGHCLTFLNDGSMLLATDGGMYKTSDNGVNWNPFGYIPNTEFYHVSANPFDTEYLLGGAQDNGTSSGNYTDTQNWPRVFGGDGFKPFMSPDAPELIYASVQYGGFYYSDDNGFNFYDLSRPLDADGEIYNWDAPWMLNPGNSTELLFGATSVYRITGAPYGFYEQISTTLTDPMSGDPNELASNHTISTIDQSGIDPSLIMAGTADGNVWITQNNGGSWQQINQGLPEHTITCVRHSANTPGTVYVTLQGYMNNDMFPHIFKSTNFGATWNDISGNLPPVGINHLTVVPAYEERLFISTDAGVWYTSDGGQTWEIYGSNLPRIRIKETVITANHRLAAATYGRSIWSVDASAEVNTGMAENKQETLTVYPTLTSQYLNFSEQCTYKIYNSIGECVKSDSQRCRTIDVSALTEGHYLVMLAGTQHNEVCKFVKQ